MANLVIVESPSKAATIKNYLGSNYKVMASYGHVRDLPKSALGVDVDGGFEAHYINIRGKGDLIKELRKEVKNANKVFLATDADREGEAISWHLAATLGIPLEQTRRVTFNEITKNAIKDAIKKPREIDMELVNSQQARRILDRIVGYKLSPFLWKVVRSGLSAGRVQSVATRIIVEREAQINAFIPEEYWTISASHTAQDGKTFRSKYYGKGANKADIHTKAEAEAILKELYGKDFVVSDLKRSIKKKNPLPPFTTSSMQQEAYKKFGFQAQRIMRIAQELYEGVSIGSENGGMTGLITYMRTDSLRIADEARDAAKQFILSQYADEYYPAAPRVYKSKGSAQDAHEAIRPTNVFITPDSIKKYLSNDQYKLYKLIWERFVASQMASAELDTVNVDIACGEHIFKASGSTVHFKGYLTIYDDVSSEKEPTLPEVNTNDTLPTEILAPEQHFTEPPARFNEGSLIKFLEEKGIGRPSTYAQIITTIVSRGYVKRDAKALVPTELGEVTTKIMIENFPEIIDYKFTADMEDSLDSIADGKDSMEGVLSKFYGSFKDRLDVAEGSVKRSEIAVPTEETDIICEKCGSRMIAKSGRFGRFAACPNYPECKNTIRIDKNNAPIVKQTVEAKPAGITCEKCGNPMVIRNGAYGNFYACSDYPKCKHTLPIKNEIGVKCPLCSGEILSRRSKSKALFYSCENYPKCTFSSWDIPTSEKCPDCSSMLMRKKGKGLLVCSNEKCSFKKESDVRDENNGN
ncbi:MAG: type I DNA topoisomerase [Ruminococcaceae bacterium]|nr:type I DNA topoisomerase [Oscillospiraceae bacterium]